MKTVFTTEASRCPACNSKLTGATDPEEQSTPSPGDVSVCAYCTLVCKFNTDLTLRQIRPHEYAALPRRLKRKVELFRQAVMTVNNKQRD